MAMSSHSSFHAVTSSTSTAVGRSTNASPLLVKYATSFFWTSSAESVRPPTERDQNAACAAAAPELKAVGAITLKSRGEAVVMADKGQISDQLYR